MARPQKTVPALPQREGIQAATVLSPNPKCVFRHPLHQGRCPPAQQLCSPTWAPTPESPKKPKMQVAKDMFPTDWSPPPIEFLNPRALQASQEPPAQGYMGTADPQGLKRLARQLPKGLEQESLDLDPKEGLASLEELLWNMAGSSQQAAALELAEPTSLTSGGSGSYVNSLDYLLQEKREQALEQEREELLLQDCLSLSSLDLHEDEAPLSPEHRMLVERFSVSLQVIPSVHPGETVFLPRRHPLPCILDCSNLKPHSRLEELFLSASPSQQLSFLRSGLLSNLYLHTSHCPVPLLQWLFQLLTWPPETSLGAFGLLWDLSVDRLFLQSDEDMHLWCPSLQEVTEAFYSLGAYSPSLYPLGPFQHSGRVLNSEASLGWDGQREAPQQVALGISLNYIYKFLTLCAFARPGAYTDGNLLGLIELLCRAGLDVGLRLLPKTDLQQLLLQLLENIQEWPEKLPKLCRALSWVSDHHHNLLALVQFFLDVTTRSRQLRSQLSLEVIARMLGQQESLPPWQENTQLSLLSRLLSLMRPSSLGQYLSSELSPPCQEQQPKASTDLDHKVCYLCHSLLILAGVVVSCQDLTPDQWGELQLLCMQLDRHISTHIRESPQAMHRTKLKDLAAQTYIRWQELLAHCQPQAQYFSPWKDI
ncbi:protein FAM178B isoform X1 [Tupaia chinensis]|uniref:protein FAM178B isoform X1 n=1 Tax=Tupaia chinensis TaxID=246437 RepID=UPI0003C8D21D|nr:protein FAM178B isoform X1 [Tupaia chinensis]XP_006166632.1 protein FAM178B isoform X1 [Tupaia chinensis]XP_006166633.1 protein FAM178B isoform X1 [Tupaia chinensis]XP_006166634.1 protein FAM178B isoform X1 [Tupaia chinensis]XP_006166635.1 protein FAM178B isoform X1 [Tupaia chinensis]